MVSVVLRMTDPLYCSLNILFGDVLITVAQSIVVVIKRLGDVPVHTGDLSQHVPGTHPCSFFHVCTCYDFVAATCARYTSLLHVFLCEQHDFVAAKCPLVCRYL